MQTARGLGWEPIGISITDSGPTDSKKAVTQSMPRAGGRKSGTAEKSGCEESRRQSAIDRTVHRELPAWQDDEPISPALSRETAALAPPNPSFILQAPVSNSRADTISLMELPGRAANLSFPWTNRVPVSTAALDRTSRLVSVAQPFVSV